MEIEGVMLDRMGGEHLDFQHDTLLKAWALVAGAERPIPPDLQAARQAIATGGARPKSRSGGVKFRKAKLPKVCKGTVEWCRSHFLYESKNFQFFTLTNPSCTVYCH